MRPALAACLFLVTSPFASHAEPVPVDAAWALGVNVGGTAGPAFERRLSEDHWLTVDLRLRYANPPELFAFDGAGTLGGLGSLAATSSASAGLSIGLRSIFVREGQITGGLCAAFEASTSSSSFALSGSATGTSQLTTRFGGRGGGFAETRFGPLGVRLGLVVFSAAWMTIFRDDGTLRGGWDLSLGLTPDIALRLYF